MVVPGESLPTGETFASASGTNPATILSQTAAARTTATNSPNHSHSKLSGGAIAGITIGAVAMLAAIGFLLFLLGRHRTEIQFLRRDIHAQTHQPPPPEMKHSYSSAGVTPQGISSSTYPYDPEDAKFRGHQAYDVPPYTKEVSGSSQPIVAELPSPPLRTEISRVGSPASELDADTKRITMSLPPMDLLESIGPGYEPVRGHGLGLRD